MAIILQGSGIDIFDHYHFLSEKKYKTNIKKEPKSSKTITWKESKQYFSNSSLTDRLLLVIASVVFALLFIYQFYQPNRGFGNPLDLAFAFFSGVSMLFKYEFLIFNILICFYFIVK